MSSERVFRWSGNALLETDPGDPEVFALEAADSLLVSDGRAFALELHRARFHEAFDTVTSGSTSAKPSEVDAFWTSAFATVPETGNWFPRVELQSKGDELHLAFRLRSAPELTKSVTLLTHAGPDPRRVPALKGPDLGMLFDARTGANVHGADDVVILTPDGFLIDGGANAILWWREDALCSPPLGDPAFARVPSVTAKSLLGLASALGIETRAERVTPDDLDGTEVWALNALHGIRMVTGWVHGPQLAEKPGRIGAWRKRREALRAPMGGATQ